MESAKKMVLISTENLERLQQQQGQSPSTTSSTTSSSSTSSATSPPVSGEVGAETATGSKETVRTPGTVLSRLDTEMYRILNSLIPDDAREKWRMYREVLQRYLYFFREREKRRLRGKYREKYGDKSNGAIGDKNEGGENTRPDDGDAVMVTAEDENTDDDDISDLEPDEQPMPSPHEAPTSHRHRHRRTGEQKSVRKIVNTVPKSFRAKARKLLSHLCDVAVPDRLSWDRHGVVSIDGEILRGSNIAELLNDAARERKTARAVARSRFARLLRDVGTPVEYVGNQELLQDIASMSLEEADFSARLREAQPRGSSTPTPQVSRQAQSKRSIGETSLEDRNRLSNRSRAVFVMNEQDRQKTRVSTGVSQSDNKRSMVDNNPLELSLASSGHNGDERRLPLARAPARKRRIGETSLDEIGSGRATFISGTHFGHKTRVSDFVSKPAGKRRLINWSTLE